MRNNSRNLPPVIVEAIRGIIQLALASRKTMLDEKAQSAALNQDEWQNGSIRFWKGSYQGYILAAHYTAFTAWLHRA